MDSEKEIVKMGTSENLKDIAAIQANAGLKFTLLEKKYIAAFQKGAQGDISFVIMPEPEQQETECSLTELCNGLNGIVQNVSETQESVNVFNAETMATQINQYKDNPANNVEGAEEMTVSVRQLFLYINKKGDKPLDVQYAISLSLDNVGLNLGKAVSLDSAWVSIWNTDIENILSKMEIEDIEKLIGQQ
jgi:hypothetical protein